MEVIGYNVSPRNLWDDITNIRPYNGRNQAQYTAEVLNPNLTAINKIQGQPLEGALRIVNSPNQESVLQTLGALPQWQKAQQIVNGTGEAIGWDLETIGDIANQVTKYDGYAGITEFGIVRRVYDGGIKQIEESASFAFGVNKDQKFALDALITRFKDNGWDSLSQSEQVTLDRLSKIGAGNSFRDVFQSKQYSFMGDSKYYWSVKKLGPSSMNIDAMRRGADYLHTLYNSGGVAEDIIPQLTSYITNAAKNNNSILYGANSVFDVTTLQQTSKRLGINKRTNFTYLQDNIVDVVNAVRTMATAQGQSVLSFTNKMHGIALSDTDRPASVESIMESLQMNRAQLHISGEDIINEGDILATKYYAQNKSFIDSLLEMTEDGIKTYDVDLNKTVFMINRGYIDQSKSDMAVIAGEAKPQSYSISNDYWQLDTSKTGMASIIDGNTGETSDKFILSLINASDKDVEVHKEFDSADDAIKFLRKNTTWLQEDSITRSQIDEQHYTSMIDKGRREFDKFFDPLSVRKNGDGINYGYDGLKQYLGIVDELGLDGKVDSKHVIAKIQSMDNNPFKSTYQVQAFAGMYQKLAEERTVLDYIVKEVDKVVGENASPVTKTIALNRAYSNVQDYLASQYVAYTPKEAYYGISDVFGIDVQVGDAIHRINAQSVTSATPGINNIFKNMSAVEAEDVIKGLGVRGLLSETQVEDLSHSIYLSFQPNAGINNFVTDVANQLVGIIDRFNTSANPIDEFRQVITDGSDPRIVAKNLQSITNNLQTGATSRFRAQDGKNFYTMSYLFDNRTAVKDAIQQRVQDSLSSVPSMSMYDGVVNNDVINKLASKLNLQGEEKTLVEEMFSKHWTQDGKEVYHSYAISSPENIKKGLQSFVVMPDGNPNAFVVLTNSKHSNNVVDILSTLNDDIDYTTMTEKLDGHASVIELHGLKKVDLGDKLDDSVSAIFGTSNATLATVNQGKNYEKFLVPVFEEYIDKKTGLIRANIKTGGEDLLSSYRLNGKRIVEAVLDGDFERGTSLIRRTQNAKFKELSAPSSYRGYVDEFGKTVRIANYHPADFLHAYEMNISGMKSLLEKMATQEVDGEYNPIQRMLYAFNEQVQIVNPDNLRTAQGIANYKTIVQSNQFEEFFAKNLLRDISLDSAMESLSRVPTDMGGYSADVFNKSIFQLMQDMVAGDTTHKVYHKSVGDALNKLGASISHINQLLPESAIQHGLISFIKPGAFNDAAGLFSTMRPTYYQQNRYMYFSPDDISDAITKDGYTVLNPSSMTKTEHTIREAIGDTVKTPKGDPFNNQYRAITTRFKQIGDADLQIRYLEASEDIAGLASKLGLDDVEKTRLALEYMQQDMSSVYEGKWFLDPILGNEEFFKQADAKKIEFNIDAVDKLKTRDILEDLFKRDAELDSNTIIARTKNGAPIFYNGPKGRLSVDNFNELLAEGRTYLLPDVGSVRDVKLMIGPEKATAHTISMTNFMKYTGLNMEDASTYAHKLFGYIFDGATVAGNIGNLKHNGNIAASSVWTAIKLEYQRADRTEDLIKSIRSNETLNRYFADWDFSVDNNMLIVDNTDAKYLDDAIIELEKAIRDNVIGDSKVNRNIIDVLDYNTAFGLSSVELERVHMNEHLSNQFRLDQRIEQGIRLRNREYLDADGAVDGIVDGFNGRIINGRGYSWDDLYVDATKKYAMSADVGMSKGFLDDDLGAIRHIADIFSTERVSSVKAYNTGVLANRENIQGVIEAARYYDDPSSFVKGNMVTVTLRDFIDNDNIPRSGVSAEELQDFIFKVDGKPSKWLQKLADEQGIKLDERSLNIFFDFGQTIKIGNKEYQGALLPVQNVIKNLDDEQFFVDSQRNITRFINEVIEEAKKPGSKSMSTVLSGFISKMNKELAIMKKDSDFYKAYGKVSLPNAGQFLAQDETPAIIDGMLTDTMIKDRARKIELEQQIRNGDLSVVQELQDVNRRINENLETLADDIRVGNLSEFTALKNKNLRAASIIEINGKKYYNNAVALGEEGFRKLGFDFGQAGMDLIYDLEARGKVGYTSHIPGIEKFSIMPSEITDIAEKINKLGINGINITEADLQERGLMASLNEQIQNKYGITDDMITTRDLNKAIINKGRKGIKKRKELRSIFDVFSDISKRYVSEIGLFGEHLRYPSFGGQPAVNVLLDTTIEGEQIRYLNPVFSIHTNVDFDGDTGFLHIKLDGSSIAKFDITDGFDGLYKSYLSGVTKGNDLIADLIAEGEAFKVDDLNDMTGQLANKLKAFKEDEYWDAAQEWATRNKIQYTGDIRDIEDDTLLYALNHSPEMRSAYSRAGFNTLTDADIIRASMIPAIRKQNIGMISTPNFNLRDTMLTFANDNTLTNAERKKLSLILNDMTNMSTKDRGLLSLTEQRGIDVKHLIDSYNIAETPKWSLGLNQLFNLKNTSDLEKSTGITNMIKASNHVLFKASDDEVQSIVKRIMSTSYEDYDGLIKGAEGKTAKKLLYEKWFRGLYEFSNMDGAATAFHAGIKTGSMDDYMRQVLNVVNNGQHKTVYGTVENSFAEAFMEAYSDQHLMYDENTVYLKHGTLDDVADTGYVFKGWHNSKAYFDEVSLDYTDRSKYLTKIGEKVFDASSAKDGKRIHAANKMAANFFNPISINVRSLREDPDLMTKPLKDLKIIDTLNEMAIHNKVSKFLGMKNKHAFGLDTYNYILGLYGGTQKNAIKTKNRIKEIERTYDFVLSSAQNAPTFSSLIRELNEDIVKNPENYGNKTQFSTYDSFVKSKIATQFGGMDAFERAHTRRIEIEKYGQFDIKKFNESLGFLNADLYDIIGEEKRLNESYEAIRRNISVVADEYKQPLQDILDSQTKTVQSVMTSVRAKNLQTVKTYQDKIYGLFKSTAQMDAWFGWNKKVSSQTKVGFGEYLNTTFGNLSKQDIANIRLEASNHSQDVYAVRRTLEALDSYKPNLKTIKATSTRTYANVNDEVSAIIDVNAGTLNRTLNKTKVDEAAQAAQRQMHKSTVSGAFFDNAKGLAKKYITPKNAGIAAASLAAIGIANNMLHNQRTQSPLTPARRPDGNGAPDASLSAAPMQQAPMSQRRVVYHDKGSGFNFKVSAKTNSYINDMNNAKLIGMSGGGQSSVYSQADMSGVTDNWLANKFAELT